MLQTYQTKLSRTPCYPTNNMFFSYLNTYGQYFQSIERKLYVDLVHRKTSINTLKQSYIAIFGITARQFNSIRVQVQGKVKAINELKETELTGKSIKLKELEIKLIILLNDKKDYKNSIDGMKMNDKNFKAVVKKYKNTKSQIHNTKRKIQEITFKISKIKSDMKKDITRICFGSKELFKKQYNLEENGFKNHMEWKTKWLESRSNQFMCLGSSDESFGNQNCQYDKENNLTIRVADKFKDVYGEYIKIPNVLFKYGQDKIDYCKDGYEVFTKSANLQKYCNGAMTHRFNRNEIGWYLNTTVEVKDKEVVTDDRVGAMVVDFNVNFTQICFIDRFGNPLDELAIKYSMYGKTSDQIDAMLGDMSVDICNLACCYKIPVYIEDLKLEDIKKYPDKNTKYNRMIGTFPYKGFRESLEARCRKTGVEIQAVNPGYTSIIGQFKFMKQYGLSSHGSAACIIARRGMGLKTEKISKKYKDMLKITRSKINLNKDNYKLWMQISSIIKAKFKFNDRISKLYSNTI